MKTYTCPMHPEIEQETAGLCSRCKMALVEKGSSAVMKSQENDYTPLVVIIGVIVASVAILAYGSSLAGTFSWHEVMMQLMAVFFIVFAGFKLLDLKGFADGYATYDLIAQRFYLYGYIYPFVELGLGLLYLGGLNTFSLNLFVLVLMTINGTGVLVKLAKKEPFQCACLGTFLKVPLTKVTLVEDFGMAAMALWMIL
jgi:hypothetical protein